MFLENQDFGVFLIKTQRHRGAENFLFYEHRRHERNEETFAICGCL